MGQLPRPGPGAGPMSGNRLLRSTAVFSAMTFLSRIAGYLRDWLQAGMHGGMQWMAEHGSNRRATLRRFSAQRYQLNFLQLFDQ